MRSKKIAATFEELEGGRLQEGCGLPDRHYGVANPGGLLLSDLSFRCSQCGGINRVPADKLGEDGKCGQCKSPLDMTGKPISLSDQELSELRARSPVPVLVDFWAPWCGPCRAFAPMLEAYAKKHAGSMIVAKINTDEHQKTAGELEVRGIPTVALWSGQKLLATQSGAMSPAQLEAWVQAQNH